MIDFPRSRLIYFCCEKNFSHEIQDIAEKLSEKEDTIKKQGDEISKLKACNRKLQQNMNKLNDKLNQQESSDNDKSHSHNNKALYSEKTKKGMHAENYANRQKETSSVKSIENNNLSLSQTSRKSLTIQANQNNPNNANLMPKQRGKTIELIELDKNAQITNGNSVNNDSSHVNRGAHVSRESQSMNVITKTVDRFSRSRPKHLVPCPFLRGRGYCLKGSKCDFLHNAFQQSTANQQFHQSHIGIRPFPYLPPSNTNQFPFPLDANPFPPIHYQMNYPGLYPPPLMKIPIRPPGW